MTIEARFEQENADGRQNARRTLRLGLTGRFAGGGESAVTVRNLSATGLLIETATLLGEGDTFAVDLPEAGTRDAEVVWADAPMYGCRFTAPVSAAALSAAQLRGEVLAQPLPAQAEQFGARLHRLRRGRGLSLGEIATRMGVSKPTVWAWEHGKSRPVERRLAALADVLGISPGELEDVPSGANEQLEQSRRQIARAYGVEPSRVRIMIEL